MLLTILNLYDQTLSSTTLRILYNSVMIAFMSVFYFLWRQLIIMAIELPISW